MKKHLFLFILGIFTIQFIAQSQTTLLSEGFDDITTLPAAGWVETNMSTPVGSIGYFQGNETVFTAYVGATTAYLAVNFNSVAGAATISNWMITPQLTLENGDIVSFWTRAVASSTYPDRLQFRLNPLGTTNVGADANSVGDFTVLLAEVNPTLAVGGYPEVWTEYSSVISGLTGPTVCRLAFRYFVTNGGPNGSNSDYIGMDELTVIRPAASGCVVCPPGGVNETETCGNHTNDGNDAGGTNYEPYMMGTNFCGTVYATDVADRDFDWLSFNIPFPSKFRFTLFSDNDMNYQLMDIGTAPTPIIATTALACDTAVIEICLLPGDYAIRVTSVNTSGITCGSNNAYVFRGTLIPGPEFLDLGSNSPVCQGDTIYLWASGGNVYEWQGPDGFTSNLSNPFIANAAAINSGTYIVGALDSNMCGNLDSVVVDVIDCTFIIENNQNSFSLYPNPATESVILKTTSSLQGEYTLTFTNELGQIVRTETIALSPETEYRLSTILPSGIYTVSIIDNQSVISGVQTLIIQ